MSFEAFDLLPALTSLAMIELVVWNGVATARTLAALRAERERQGATPRER